MPPKKLSNQASFYDQLVSSQLLATFNEHARIIRCAHDEVLFRTGGTAEYVYLLRSGEVALTIPFSNERAMEFHAKTGALLGLPAAFSNQPYSMTAVAAKDSEVAVIRREEFCGLISSNPSLSLDVLRILAAETRAARLAITAVGMNRRGQ
jgi:CRP-like cAMP-binding protein